MRRAQYSDEDVKNDIKSFFLDDGHWGYQYGSPTPSCGPDSPYHRKQLEVLFESKYMHWVTDRAVHSLIDEGFLREKAIQLPTFEVRFVYRRNLRYVSRAIRDRASIIRMYSNQSVSTATGEQAEFWFHYLSKGNSFRIIARNAKEYRGILWTKTDHNLDFIVEKDDIAYGIEVKNTFPYMENDEFEIKLEMCKCFGIIPLFALRAAPYSQIESVKNQNGLILIFRSKIFPPGYQQLVKNIWNFMRLPVSIWKDIPPRLEQILLTYHARNINT